MKERGPQPVVVALALFLGNSHALYFLSVVSRISFVGIECTINFLFYLAPSCLCIPSKLLGVTASFHLFVAGHLTNFTLNLPSGILHFPFECIFFALCPKVFLIIIICHCFFSSL